MAYLLRTIHNTYQHTIAELADPRLENWFLMDSISNIIFIQIAYVYVVKVFGPKLMADKKPFKIDSLLIVYNFVQMLINGYIFYLVAPIIFRTFNTSCNEIDYSNNPDAITLLEGMYLYFLTKLIDLLDTVFFVLRKKNKQISFLHVYHHCMLIFFAWVTTKFLGGGHSIFAPMINSFVHTCMYGYYLLSVIDKDIKKSHKLKRRITELQLMQFIIGLFLLSGPILIKSCKYPAWFSTIILVQHLFFLSLFGDFYLKTYVYPRKKLGSIGNFGCLTVMRNSVDEKRS